ncbi:MAG: hypothetical protein ACLQD8_05455 [Thermoplasmata archaeon]
MDDLIAEGLAVVLMGFSGALAALAVATSQQFGERRFLLVAAGFSALTVASALAAVSELYDIFNETFAIGTAPLLLLVVATVFLYLAMFRARVPPGRPGHG